MTPSETEVEPGVLDLRGLKCPLPALFAKRTLERTPRGDSLTVLTDDPMARIDVPHMCRQEGYEVVSVEASNSVTKIVLQRPD